MCPNGRLTEGETSEFDRCKHLDVDMGKWAVELANWLPNGAALLG